MVDWIWTAPTVIFALAGGGASAGSQGGTGLLMQFAPLVLIFVIFWFLLIRPQQKRAKEHRMLLESLKEGDDVVTESGFHGTIRKLGESVVTLEIAPKVLVKMARARIATRIQAEGSTQDTANKPKAKASSKGKKSEQADKADDSGADSVSDESASESKES